MFTKKEEMLKNTKVICDIAKEQKEIAGKQFRVATKQIKAKYKKQQEDLKRKRDEEIALIESKFQSDLAVLNQQKKVELDNADEFDYQLLKDRTKEMNREQAKAIEQFKKTYGPVTNAMMLELLKLETGREWKYWPMYNRGEAIICNMEVKQQQYFSDFHPFAMVKNVTIDKYKDQCDDLDWMEFYLYKKGLISKRDKRWYCNNEKDIELFCSAIEHHHFPMIDKLLLEENDITE